MRRSLACSIPQIPQICAISILSGNAESTKSPHGNLFASAAYALEIEWGIYNPVSRSTVLSPMEEAAIVVLRLQARLSLDDMFIALKDVIPHLTRSLLHRCLQRHGISRLARPSAVIG